MSRSKSNLLLQHEKVLSVLASGPCVENGDGCVLSVSDIMQLLGDSVHEYRMSVYMFLIKKDGVTVRSIRAGKKVVGYQIPSGSMRFAKELLDAKSGYGSVTKPAGTRARPAAVSAAATLGAELMTLLKDNNYGAVYDVTPETNLELVSA